MESLRDSGLGSFSAVTRKRRTASRRPRPDSQLVLEGQADSPPSLDHSPDKTGKQSPDSGDYDAGIHRKEFNINRIYRNDHPRNELSESAEYRRSGLDQKRFREGLMAPRNWKNTIKFKENAETLPRSPNNYASHTSGDGHNLGDPGIGPSGSAENKLRKVKLKVGGVTHTIHAQSKSEGVSDGGSSVKPQHSSNDPQHRHRTVLVGNSDDHSLNEKGGGSLRGPQCKDFGGKKAEGSLGVPTNEPVRKSKRAPKRRVLDEAFDGDEDDEIKYLERMKSSKVSADYRANHEDDRKEVTKKLKSSKASKKRKNGYDEDGYFASSGLSKGGRKKPVSEGESDDMDYLEDEEPGSDAELEDKRRKQDPLDSSTDGRKKSLTTRQQALQSCKNGSASNGSSLIEFPNGLAPAPPRKQKEKLSEVEQQLKKAEVAHRRRMQAEKAARESEAEAIRKILGQDSSRKKREDKLQKMRDELAQAKAANSMALASNCIRWHFGPTGTIVTFADSIGLPSILTSKPISYPPPREKCAGPSCTNPYKYRDSKSLLPLCSLQCYRAVHPKMQQLNTS